MAHIISLSPASAIPLWNDFTASLPVPAPFSFNPSLFYFYQKHFHWKPYYLLLYESDNIAGLLPLVNTGKAWVSLPHFSYGGWLEKENINNKIAKIYAILQELQKGNFPPGFYQTDLHLFSMQEHLHSERLFIRSFGEQQDNKSEKVTYILHLKNEEALFSGLSSNLRRKIRKASKSGLKIKTGSIELLDDFYGVYSKNIFLLKSLNYGKSFFSDLFSCWKFGEMKFVVAYNNGKPVGGTLLASYNDFYENLFFATEREIRRYYVSDRLHWQMILYALSNQKKDNHPLKNSVYSFGRSTIHSTVHAYKMHWPVTVVPLSQYSTIHEIKQNSLIHYLWSGLPYCITKPLGTRLIKHIY